MRTRIVIVFLLFVIAPTALLSFMAARVLRNWELLLVQRMELDAASTIQSVAGRIDDRLRQPLEKIVATVSGIQARGAMERDMAHAAMPLRESSELVSRVYVFMNPWDFLYPARTESSQGTARGDGSPGAVTDRDLLLATLRREIASASSPRASLRFTVDERAFVFGLVSMEGIYAGYEVDPDAFRNALELELTEASGMFILCAEGPGMQLAPPDGQPPSQAKVKIVDSLTAERGAVYGSSAPSLVAETRLKPPFGYIRIRAFVGDPLQARRMGRLRARMYGWSVVLLAMFILGGAGFTLHAAAVELRQARARSDYVIGVSHDLRTPLSSMMMLTESLYTDRITDPEKRKHFLGTVLRECERLNQLIERVLFFVRYGQKALVFHREEVDLGALVVDAVDALVARSGGGGPTRLSALGDDLRDAGSGMRDAGCGMRDAGSGMRDAGSGMRDAGNGMRDAGVYRTVGQHPRIRVVVPRALPRTKIDYRAMMQVLLNMLDNAEKYGKRPATRAPRHATPDTLPPTPDTLPPTRDPRHASPDTRHAPPDTLPLDIDVRVDRVKRRRWGKAREWIRIGVRDFGMGLEPGVIKRIFTPFYRSPRAGMSNVSGVGVGLALCRHVVRAHGGRIEVESEVGKGSTFYVMLPVEEC